jgi:hypothetical protein
LAPSLFDGKVHVNGAQWTIVQSEGDVEV